MKRILEIVPAQPGWYARWRYASAATRCYPLILWVLLEETDGGGRRVVGLDRIGQWPGSDGNGTGVTFVRYLFLPPEAGDPGDAVPGPIGPPGRTPPAGRLIAILGPEASFRCHLPGERLHAPWADSMTSTTWRGADEF